MLRRFLYSWDVRFAAILPLIHVIVSSVLLWSAPVPFVADDATFDFSEPTQYRLIFAMNPPGVIAAAIIHQKIIRRGTPRVMICTGIALGCLLWWRLGCYVDRAGRRAPKRRSVILLVGTLLWTLAIWRILFIDGVPQVPSSPAGIAMLVSAAILWPAAGFLAARDVRPAHLIS